MDKNFQKPVHVKQLFNNNKNNNLFNGLVERIGFLFFKTLKISKINYLKILWPKKKP